MLKKIAISTAVAASALTILPAAAEAQSRYGYSSRYDNGYYAQRYGDSYYGNGYYQPQRYDRRYARQPYYGGRYYNHYGRRCSGSTGTILGAIAGGLLGSEVAGHRGDRTLGAIIGAGAGALAGRAIDRSDCR